MYLEQESQIHLPPISQLNLPNTDQHDSQEHRLHGYRLVLARAGWLVIVGPALVVFLVCLPGYFAALHHLPAPGVGGFTGQLPVGDRQQLAVWGLSLDFYAVGMLAVSLLFQLSYAVAGGLLFWRKSADLAALVASFALMLFPFGYAALTLQALPPAWGWLRPTLMALGNISIMLCAYTFPDGRLVPGITRPLALVVIGYWTIAVLPARVFALSTLLDNVLFFGLILSTLLVQLYRYRYVSTSRQRQQTRWVLFGIAIAVLVSTIARLLILFVLRPRLPGSALPALLEVVCVSLSMLAIPPTLGMAILRSRLWEIDVIINRALVYGALTLMLAQVYAGLVIGLEFLLGGLTGGNQLALVASTLSIAALFQPLRRRLQSAIDSRFYRRKYDAARTLAAFNATLRHEVDLEQLSEHLMEVVEETMQPAHVSLWLRRPEREQQASAVGGEQLTSERTHIVQRSLRPLAPLQRQGKS